MASKFGRFGDNGAPKTSALQSLKVQTRPQGSSALSRSKPGASSGYPSQSESAAITQQVAQWDNEMDCLDKQQEQLLNDQWRLLRTQIGSLMSALAEVKSDMNDLKNNVLSKDMESVIENMVSAHDGHDQNHATIFGRLDYIENMLGESADKHGEHEKHKASMEERMEYLEGLLGDSADKHNDVAKTLAQMQADLAGCGSADHHATLEERVNYLEGFLGESADKHAKDLKDHKAGWEDHKANMETRLEYLEALAGDSADNHAKEIEAAKKSLKDLHAAVSTCAKAEHHSSMEKRMEYLENLLGESADKHDDHKTSVETRLEFVEGMLGDSAEKHAKEIEAAKGKLQDLHAAIKSTATKDHHASLEKRLDYLEKFLGESVDKHDDHKATMDTRLEYVEALLGDSADKHTKELEAAKAKLGSLDKAINSCAKADHHGNLEQRVDYLERCLGDHSGKSSKDIGDISNTLNSHKKSMEQRLDYIEKLQADNSDSKSMTTKIDFAEARIRDLAQKVDQARSTADGTKSSLEQRMSYLESQANDANGSGLIGRVDQRVAGIQEDTIRQQENFKHSIHMSIKEQMDLINSVVMNQSSQMKELWDRESMSRHAAMENYKQLLQQERTSRDAVASSLEERMMSIELAMGAEPPKVINYVAPPCPPIATYTVGTMSPRVSVAPPQIVKLQPVGVGTPSASTRSVLSSVQTLSASPSTY